ncbi:MAG: FKBP-type peptidyl-prolyl cis-trans isomerase [Deltaproteobacteria bacterium]|nr:FKBP-type peptidyl-prolyl cis-trans isomerase [Deltaproteobacteria bacterium]MBW2401033.1 FKBP-type peptidyl-prolyl cis-trans isomerase [Deltaproteobacteria bacterium]
MRPSRASPLFPQGRFALPDEKPSSSLAKTQPGSLFSREIRFPPRQESTTMPEAPPVPDDVAAPPADVETTASGLATKLLRPGTSDERPTANDTVEVHYSGWTTDGELFDSSVTRGESISFGLRQVIAGWTEGVQLMSVGESRRLWIPEELAYQGRPGSPAGMLVFDVELISIRGR